MTGEISSENDLLTGLMSGKQGDVERRAAVSDTLIELAATACGSPELLSTLDFAKASPEALAVALDNVRDAGLLLIMLECRLRSICSA